LELILLKLSKVVHYNVTTEAGQQPKQQAQRHKVLDLLIKLYSIFSPFNAQRRLTQSEATKLQTDKL
jgi:hypothetical protein